LWSHAPRNPNLKFGNRASENISDWLATTSRPQSTMQSTCS